MAFRALSGDVRFKAKLRKRDKRAVYGGTNLLHRPEYQDLDFSLQASSYLLPLWQKWSKAESMTPSSPSQLRFQTTWLSLASSGSSKLSQWISLLWIRFPTSGVDTGRLAVDCMIYQVSWGHRMKDARRQVPDLLWVSVLTPPLCGRKTVSVGQDGSRSGLKSLPNPILGLLNNA